MFTNFMLLVQFLFSYCSLLVQLLFTSWSLLGHILFSSGSALVQPLLLPTRGAFQVHYLGYLGNLILTVCIYI